MGERGFILVLRQEDYAKAEPMLLLSLRMRERLLGADHSSVASASLDNYSSLLREMARGADADVMRQRADDMRERLGSMP